MRKDYKDDDDDEEKDYLYIQGNYGGGLSTIFQL